MKKQNTRLVFVHILMLLFGLTACHPDELHCISTQETLSFADPSSSITVFYSSNIQVEVSEAGNDTIIAPHRTDARDDGYIQTFNVEPGEYLIQTNDTHSNSRLETFNVVVDEHQALVLQVECK